LRFHVSQGKIKSLESIYLFSMPVKEYQIVEYFLGSALKDEVMKIMPVQKQTRAGQRTRFKVSTVRSASACGGYHTGCLQHSSIKQQGQSLCAGCGQQQGVSTQWGMSWVYSVATRADRLPG
jgi:hypothetical protein